MRAFHAPAHGGTSEGAPGLHLPYNDDFYAAYVRDPDGNKLAAVFRGFSSSGWASSIICPRGWPSTVITLA